MRRFPHKTLKRVANGIRPLTIRQFLMGLRLSFQRNQSEGLDATYHFTATKPHLGAPSPQDPDPGISAAAPRVRALLPVVGTCFERKRGQKSWLAPWGAKVAARRGSAWRRQRVDARPGRPGRPVAGHPGGRRPALRHGGRLRGLAHAGLVGPLPPQPGPGAANAPAPAHAPAPRRNSGGLVRPGRLGGLGTDADPARDLLAPGSDPVRAADNPNAVAMPVYAAAIV